MIRDFIKIAFRNLSRNPLYSLVNTIGLAVGMSACLLISLYVSDELSYDGFQKNGARIVRAIMEYRMSGTKNNTVYTGTKVGPEFKRSFPEVESFVRTMKQQTLVANGSISFNEDKVLYADRDFFKIFSFPLLRGDVQTSLAGPNRIVLTTDEAHKYFGEADPIGQTLKLNNLGDYEVTAIAADPPENSQIKYSIVVSFESLDAAKTEQWFTANYNTYILLDRPDHIAGFQAKVVEKMKSVTKNELHAEGDDYLTYSLEPLLWVHLHSPYDGFEPNGSITSVAILIAIGVLILLIACINYANLATARSSGRSTEIGIRKVLGSRPLQVFIQFIGESSAITCIALLVGLVLSALILPLFNSITGKSFTLMVLVTPWSLALLAILGALVSFLSGAYPALLLSRTSPQRILKAGVRLATGGTLFRKSLIVFQFVISIFLIVAATIILRQVRYIENRDLGYNRFNVVSLTVGRDMHAIYPQLKQAMATDREVLGVTGAYEEPTFIQWGDGISMGTGNDGVSLSVNAIPVDLDFTHTMGMHLIAGSDFTPADFQLQDTSNNYANYKSTYILNETAARDLGWTPAEAIGKTISRSVSGQVKAVIRDFNFASLHEHVGPLVIFLDTTMVRRLFIRISGDNVPATLGRLSTIWKSRVSNRPFDYHFLDQDFNSLYQKEERSAQLCTLFAAVTIALACLGLFALATYSTQQRTKEIGIRKVMGADVGSIFGLVTKEFVALVFVSLLISLPLSGYAMDWWLSDFAYRIQPGIWVFVGAGALSLLIAVASVGFQAVRAARANPVKSLRYE